MAKNFIASLPVMRPSLSETDREKEKGFFKRHGFYFFINPNKMTKKNGEKLSAMVMAGFQALAKFQSIASTDYESSN